MGNERSHDATQPGYRKPIRSKVMTYMSERPGSVVWLDQIVNDVCPDQSPTKVRQNMATMVREVPGLTCFTRGQAWVYNPNASADATNTAPAPAPARRPTGRIWQDIGQAKDGSLILEATDGTLWRATEL